MASEAEDVKEAALTEQEVFGFNDPRYADLQLRLMIVSQSSSLPLPVLVDRFIDNDSSATMSTTSSEPRDSGRDDGAILHLSSLILGQSSPYFRKILNERRLSDPSQMVVYLAPQEKAAFLAMVRSLYCGQVKAKTTAELMSVFELADRLMVHTCINLCSKLMQELTMTFELSVRILDACMEVEQSDDTKNLVSMASSFLLLHFEWPHSSVWDAAKQDEWKRLSPHVIQTLLASDSLLVSNEDKAFEMLGMWISANCNNSSDGDSERNRVLWEAFGQLIRWPLMESFCLQKYFRMFDSREAVHHPLRSLIIEALIYRLSRIENAWPNLGSTSRSTWNKMFQKRVNHPVPVTFIRMSLPYDHAIAFFSVSGSELDKLPSGECRYSERFWMGPFGMQWKMRRPKSRDECYNRNGYYCNGDGYKKAILVRVDYFSVLTAEKGGCRPCVTLCVWDVNQKVYVEIVMLNAGWFATGSHICVDNDVFSFRAELKLPIISQKDYD